jgi:ABC-type transporter Mla subunit MlaD
MTNSSERLDRIEALVESNAKSIQALSTTVSTVSTAVDGLAAIQQQLVEIIEADREDFREFRSDMREFRATTGAALERIDRVMDYLMRRDGEKSP